MPFNLNVPYSDFSRKVADFQTILHMVNYVKSEIEEIMEDIVDAYERHDIKPDSRFISDLQRIKRDLPLLLEPLDTMQALCDVVRVFRGDIEALDVHTVFSVRSGSLAAFSDQAYFVYCGCICLYNAFEFQLNKWLKDNPNEILVGFPFDWCHIPF